MRSLDSIEHRDGGAGRRERRGVLTAETAVATRDDGDFAVQPEQVSAQTSYFAVRRLPLCHLQIGLQQQPLRVGGEEGERRGRQTFIK